MRVQTGPEAALLAGANYWTAQRTKVANGDGTLIDLSTWVESWDLDDDIDRPVSTLSLTFRRDGSSTLSLVPLRTDSTLNRLDDGVTYSPQLDAGRLITFETQAVAIGGAVDAGAWQLEFRGYLDEIDAASPSISTFARDEGGVLQDAWIQDEYALAAAQPVEDAIQELLDATLGAGVVTLEVEGTPTMDIPSGYVQSQPLMEAVQTWAQDMAWDLRYKWNEAAGAFKLTLYEPPRSNTTPDRTWGPSTYYDASRLVISREGVRNKFHLSYPDGTSTGPRAELTDEDATSIARYGERFMGITEGSDSPIDSVTEATNLLAAIKSDLKDPKAEFEIEAQYFWPGQLHDLYRFSDNDVHFNTNQDWAVVSRRQSGRSDGSARTYLKVRGTPAGGYLSWRKRASDPGEIPETERQLQNFRLDSVDEAAGTHTYAWEVGGLVDSVWFSYLTFEMPVPVDPWADVSASVLPISANTITVPVPPVGSNRVLYLQVEARDSHFRASDIRRATIEAAVPDIPAIINDDAEDATTGTLFIAIQERGIAVATVEAQTQVGDSGFSAFGEPMRDAGDSSTVNGGLLGAGEYEHDVPLDSARFSWITFRVTLETGEQMTVGPVGYDPTAEPTILNVSVAGTVITATGDSDVDSWKFLHVGGTWEYVADGSGQVVDVSKPGTNAVAGMGAGDSWNVEITAYSDPTAAITAATLTAVRDVQVVGSGSTEPVWDHVSTAAPVPTDDVAEVLLEASAAPGGYTARVWERHRERTLGSSGAWTAFANITASLSPALGAPPTSLTTYDYATGNTHTEFGGKFVTYEFRCEILDGSSVVVATQTVTTTYEIPE